MSITLNALNDNVEPDSGPSKNTKRLDDAAKQFESLMIAQMMKAARDTSGWLSDGDEPGEDSSMGMAEQQFAQSMANSGGLGLAKMVVRTMASAVAKADASAHPTVGSNPIDR